MELRNGQHQIIANSLVISIIQLLELMEMRATEQGLKKAEVQKITFLIQKAVLITCNDAI
jgi:hypothetical protein